MVEPEIPTSESRIQDPVLPRSPWSFLGEALPGGCSWTGIEFMTAWAAFFLLTNTFWALHLRRLAGWSSLPNYWGELLTARDLWELVENGGLKHHWTGVWAPAAALVCGLWFLWSGWRLQAAALGRKARPGAWALGFLDALILGALPILAVGSLVTWVFSGMAASGIQWMGWLDWVGGTLVKLACVSVFFLQWWICRAGRVLPGSPSAQGGFRGYAAHLTHSFLRLWAHPVQWTLLVLGGVGVRTGLTFAVLALAWRWGGGSAFRVWGILLLQVAVVILNAWLIGWFMRLAALFVRQEEAVREEIRQLQVRASHNGIGSVQ